MTFFEPRVLLSNSTTFIWELPHGKPDRTIFLENGEVDRRERVVQPAQKGPACQFYAMNRLRKRIGPLHGSDYIEARRVERLTSRFFKNRSELRLSLSLVLPMLWKLLVAESPFASKNQIARALVIWKPILLEDVSLAKAIPYLEEFLEESDHEKMEDYISEKRRISEFTLSSQFCHELGTSLEILYRESLEMDIDLLIELQEDMSEEIKKSFKERAKAFSPTMEKVLESSQGVSLISMLVYVAAFRAFQFKPSRWTPYQPVDELISALRSEGPLIVGGHFGKEMYKTSATTSSSIEGIPVYSWKPTDRHSKEEIDRIERHAIVIIGAQKVPIRGGLVYFIDPHDPSDPHDLLQQKIYKISYENLQTNLVDNLGRVSNLLRKAHKIGYAIYTGST